MDGEGSGDGARARTARYRYRTTVLCRQWRSSPEEAAQDAIRAGQAEFWPEGQHGVRWRVNGTIEEQSGGQCS